MMIEAYIKDVEGCDAVVLFIHGFLGNPSHFNKFIELLPENISVYNVLLCGHGGTVRDFAKASMEKWKKQIEETVDLLVKKYSKIFVVGHSMGTLFSIEAAMRYPKQVKAIYLLQSPLKIKIKARAVWNSIKAIFSKDSTSVAYQNAHSVKLNFKLWQYFGWIPRYMELRKESKIKRETLKQLEVPCTVFQAVKDELVSIKSVKYIPEKENITLYCLDNSAHFIYSPEDMDLMQKTIINGITERLG